MSDIPLHVARTGKTIGTFSLLEVRESIISGKIVPTDHFWRTGMTDWKPISTLAGEISQLDADIRLKAESSAKAKLDAEQSAQAAQLAEAAQLARAKQASQVAQVNQRQQAMSTQVIHSTQSPMVMPSNTTLGSWECLTCKYGFTLPVEPKSGYDTIRRAVILGACSLGALTVGGIITAVLSADGLRIIAGFFAFVTVVAFLVLLFMFFFEFISSSVHHGIFRAGSLKRCPGCSSHIIRKIL